MTLSLIALRQREFVISKSASCPRRVPVQEEGMSGSLELYPQNRIRRHDQLQVRLGVLDRKSVV